MSRSRGGLTTKIHALVEARGLPIRLVITPAQTHDTQTVAELLSHLPAKTMLLTDRGYDADAIRQMVAAQGAWANIPPKSNRKQPICFSPHLYKARNLVERFFNKIKHSRRIATRYDKLAENYLAALKLVAVRLWLRVYESTT